MCASQPKISYQTPPSYSPYYTPAPEPPPPPPPPPAPTPYYDTVQTQKDAQAGLNQANSLSNAKVGRAALKIDLVNNTGSTSNTGVNSAN
jgi:hypothetical protein